MTRMVDITIISRAAAGIAIMIILDIIAGFTAAASHGEVDSKILREGLMHKLGLVLAFSLSIALEYENAILELGIDVPLVSAVSVYIVIMEACSVYENIRRINPEFEFTGFDELFHKLNGRASGVYEDKDEQDKEDYFK